MFVAGIPMPKVVLAFADTDKIAGFIAEYKISRSLVQAHDCTLTAHLDAEQVQSAVNDFGAKLLKVIMHEHRDDGPGIKPSK